MAQLITTVPYHNQTYYVFADKVSDAEIATFQIWFRKSNISSSSDDLEIIELSAKNENIDIVKAAACRTQDFFDSGKMIAGCGSIIGSAFCAAATVASEGTGAFLCEATWKYTLDKGAADCFEGIADIVARDLGKQDEWMALGIIADLGEPEITTAIGKAINYLCNDVKSNSE